MKRQIKLRKSIAQEFKQEYLAEKIVLFQPIWIRIFHWGFAFCLTPILLTGLELHYPAGFLNLKYSTVLTQHIIFSWFSLGFMALRITDAILRKDSSLIPRFYELKRFPRLLAYYFFLRPSPPPCHKYNSGQVLIYFSWIILFLTASFLGLASYWQGKHLIWLWRLVGGFQILRWIKFSITIYFLATIPLHIYLSLTEDLSRLQAMITGYEHKSPPRKS